MGRAARPDWLIVGGGSAGCVLANRLSADPDSSVLLLEAGRPDSLWDLFVHMPAGLSFPIGERAYDWRYETEPEPHLGGRRVYHARGKLLGGSSSINGMIWIRGNPGDYDAWARRPGLERWSYADCLPCFKRCEATLTGDASVRGREGPLKVERGPCESPLFAAFFEAAEQAGFPVIDDVNGATQEGFSPFDRNVHRGRRLSSARAYLHPVLDRPNLEVRTRAQVARVRFEGARAVGVELLDGARIEAGEVVLCGGAFNSPQLLLLSGVGPAAELEALGIEVVADVPGVGRHLQDHLEVYVQHACTQPVSAQPATWWWNRPWVGLRWLLTKTGPVATNHFEAGGFVRSHAGVDRPNVMFHFLPLAIRYDGSAPGRGHGYQVHVGPTLSDARGRLWLGSADPRDPPRFRFNYLSTERDRREWLAAIEVAREILGQPALAPFDGGELSPGPDVVSDEQVLAWVARDAETALHPCGTARMGTGPLGVTDPSSLRVRGVEGLRVVDASVFPSIPNGNLHAPVTMVAERAAELALGGSP